MAYRQTERVVAQLTDRRDRILRAARRVVSEGGWSMASVANVASAAGVAAGTIYRYWSSKADLCAEIVSAVSEREVGVVRKIAEADGPAGERLDAAVRTFAGRALRGRRLAYALIAEPVDPEVEAVRLAYRRDLARYRSRLVDACCVSLPAR
jgi:AcrR family transcriptional regulator